MLRALGTKIGLLLATTAAVLWIGWEGRYDPAGSSRTVPPAVHEAVFPLDLNRATVDELTALPGVGKVIANRIIERRKNNGFYYSIQQLLDVRGIGETRLSRIRPLVSVSQGGTAQRPRAREGRKGS